VLHGNAKGLKASGTGSINSPNGADVANPTLTGPANLSFIVSYAFGASAPTGQDLFTFPAGNLNLRSTALTSLSFSSSGAQVNGNGTVNGSGSYGFLLVVGDSDAAKSNGLVDVRMKIWDAGKGESTGVIYDTQPGVKDSAAPTTPLIIPPAGGGDAAAPPRWGGSVGGQSLAVAPFGSTAVLSKRGADNDIMSEGSPRILEALFAWPGVPFDEGVVERLVHDRVR
jgi:hypothetical protein